MLCSRANANTGTPKVKRVIDRSVSMIVPILGETQQGPGIIRERQRGPMAVNGLSKAYEK